MRQAAPLGRTTRLRRSFGRLLSTAGPILIAASPALVLAQVAVNTARVAAPSGMIDPIQGNNEAIENDAVLAAIAAGNDSVSGIGSASGGTNVLNLFAGDQHNGAPATPANTTLALAPGSSLPPGITVDFATGQVSVAPGTPTGVYTFSYQLCERLNPTNCAVATAMIEVVQGLGAVSGIVFNDDNSDRARNGSEPLRAGWIVEIYRNGVLVGTTTTDANGAYSFPGLASGPGYSVTFRNPTNNVVYAKIENLNLPAGGSLTDQNLPIDPSGVVYDAVTRNPIAGATVRMTDAGGNPLPAVCFIDPSQATQVTGPQGEYLFDLVPGAAPQCPTGETVYRIQVVPPAGYAAPVSTVIAAQTGVFDGTGLPSPIQIVPNAGAPTGNQPTTYWLDFRLASGDPDVVHNHIPLDPFLSRTPLVVSKTSTQRTANVGDIVPYTITVRNTEAVQRDGVMVVDLLPAGFRYVEGSARVDGIAQEPQVNGRTLTWTGQVIPANSVRTYQLMTVIGAGVTTGDRTNVGLARNTQDADISNRGEAVVSITPSAVFDCAEVIGKVFDDLNSNGYQDQGEPGIPAARLSTVNGELITTDEFGRFHITCAAVPNGQIGSNYVLKLDTATIPEGYSPTIDNPQSIRLTPGKIVELNFGVRRAETARITIDSRAFVPGQATLRPEFAARLAALTETEAERLIVSITYDATNSETDALVQARLQAIQAAVAQTFANDPDWDRPAPHIETNMRRPVGRPGQESN